MNLIEQQVLEMIGENISAPDVFTDDSTGMAQIRDSINDAIEEIAMLTGSVQRSYHMLLRAGQGWYRMDFRVDRFGWVTDAWLISVKRRLEQTDIHRLNQFNARWLINQGNPEAYIQIGKDVLAVWPRPASDLVLDLTCVVVPARYAEDYDPVRLRSIFRMAAADYAVSEYYASRGDARQATEHFTRYLERLGVQSLYPRSAERRWHYKTEKNRDSVTG